MSNKIILIFLFFAGCGPTYDRFDFIPAHVRVVNEHEKETLNAINFINKNLGEVLIYGGGNDINISVHPLTPGILGYSAWDEYPCKISIDPKIFESAHPDTVYAHELLHCLGYHTHSDGIMRPADCQDIPLVYPNIPDDVFEWFNKYYNN